MADDERAKLLIDLVEKQKVTFGGIRKTLGMKKPREYEYNYTFNFEMGGAKDMPGNKTAVFSRICNP